MDEEKIPFPRLQEYLKNALTQHSDDIPAILRTRAMAKWYFDVLKNLFVIGALAVLVKKTDSYYVKQLYIFSSAVLLVYCVSYLNTWSFNPFHFVERIWLRLILGLIFWLPIYVLAYWGIFVGLNAAVDVIVSGSGK
jgi:hypothetical protein